VIVPVGKTLTISPGTHIKIANGANLIVNGTLQCLYNFHLGNITFDPVETNGSWGSIIFDGSTALNSDLQHVIITNSNGIQCLNGADIIIQNSSFNKCVQGIYIFNSQPTIINNIINDPQQNGIVGEASGLSLWIQGNTITRTTNIHNYQGIFLVNQTCPDILNNNISGFYWGIYLGGGCQSNTFGSEFWICNNRITDNRHGIGTAYYSYTTVGEDDGTGAFNSIFNNVLFDITTYQHSYLTCFHNYLGDNPKLYSDSTSNNDWDVGFTYDICNGSNKGVNNNNLVANNLKKSGNDTFLEGIKLEKEGKINEAIDFYNNLIIKDDHVNIALARLLLLMNKYSKPEIKNYFESLVDNQTKYYGKVKNLIGDIYLQNDQFDDAIASYNSVIKNSPIDYDGINARFEKLFAFLHIKEDPTTALQILSEIKDINSKDDEVQMRINIAENLINGTNNVMRKNANAAEVNIPKTYGLYQNYPNPFNPSTTIKYQIPKPGMVTLKVYDILGREVATLVNENKIEGFYDFTFNASRFASGIYIYQFRVNDYVSSKKMILIK
jgi:tetratricopeptide (TPR) repeat protein